MFFGVFFLCFGVLRFVFLEVGGIQGCFFHILKVFLLFGGFCEKDVVFSLLKCFFLSVVHSVLCSVSHVICLRWLILIYVFCGNEVICYGCSRCFL